MTTNTAPAALSNRCTLCDAQPGDPCRNLLKREVTRDEVHYTRIAPPLHAPPAGSGMRLQEHPVSIPERLDLSPGEIRVDEVLTVQFGDVRGELHRCVSHHPAGTLTVTYDAVINGINDEGAGIADVHIADVANLADLGAVADVLSAELLKANAAIPEQQRASTT